MQIETDLREFSKADLIEAYAEVKRELLMHDGRRSSILRFLNAIEAEIKARRVRVPAPTAPVEAA